MLPIVTVSEANGGVKHAYKNKAGKTCYKGEHWSDKDRRHKLQKGTVHMLLRPHRDLLSIPCTIVLTRYAPKKLDKFENLPMSLKWVLDAVCEVITNDYVPGHADGNEGIQARAEQIKSDCYGVLVRIDRIV